MFDTETLILLPGQFPRISGRQVMEERAGITVAWKEMLGAKNKKRETKSATEHCSGTIINEWRRQMLQGGTVGLLVLLLLHIKDINNGGYQEAVPKGISL